MIEKKFKRGDRVYDERYGNGIVDYSENHLIVEFRMGQYITYDLKGYRHFPESKEPVLQFRQLNNKIMTNKSQLYQVWYWIRAALALSVMVGACWFIAEHKIALDIFVWTLGLGLIGGLIYCFKVLMGVAFKDDGFED